MVIAIESDVVSGELDITTGAAGPGKVKSGPMLYFFTSV
jgi:hypothetical protein